MENDGEGRVTFDISFRCMVPLHKFPDVTPKTYAPKKFLVVKVIDGKRYCFDMMWRDDTRPWLEEGVVEWADINLYAH